MFYNFPVVLKPDTNGTFLASFSDVPEALTVGETEADALYWAADALHVALTGYLDYRRDIPRPSRPKRGQKLVALPPHTALKLAIYQAMRDQGLSQSGLARRLECDPRQVRRLIDLDLHSRLDLMEAALKALGKRLVLEVQDAA
jgi:antitoxin HicB